MRRVLRFHAAKGRSADSMGRRRVSSAIEIYYKERESDMANRNGKCPKCGGELSIPEELAKFSCMYCGAVLTQEELVIIQEKKEKNPLGEILQKLYENGDEKAEDLIDQMLELDQYDAKANEIYARLHFNEIIFEHLDVMERFSRSEYAACFESYKRQCHPVLETVDRYAMVSEDKGEPLMHELAAALVKALDEAVAADASLRSKNARAMKLDQYKMILAVYAIPMVQEQKLSIGGRLADILVEEWISAHPKSKIAKGNYQDMVVGFKKGKMCFITTAVCESFGKPDDCYELTCFRDFRDNHMLRTKEGRALVEEYYEIAPGIVTCINLGGDGAGIYEDIWKKWLSPCLSDIEAGRTEACGRRYQEMVESLKGRYLYGKIVKSESERLFRM